MKLNVFRLAIGFAQPRGGETAVLEDINLRIPAGEFVVILGASGCGKSTLLNVIAGFLKPSSGEVWVDDRPVSGPGPDRGVVLQTDALYPWLDARENVGFGLKLRGISRQERRERADEALRLVGLEDKGDHAIWQLSGGQRQRVSLARALIADPDILLMDEPLGALDALTREQMQDLVLEVWARTGKTVLFVTHGLDEALYLGSRLIVLGGQPGRVLLDKPLSFGRRAVEERIGGRIKSTPAFAAAREELHDLFFAGAER
ncbi:ABC transporter ATP-binding protein [Ancylobacter sp. 6x-1]|uniref:ABC transporter ATP-binding protein n=1 Tax=Ancylobacter crimeensis TaxID=2579147 RepID=A0ABT0D5U7_9HYPH|nr:ABC transporter ATP-binding protein [Ancylobacter crimeensis]MCK0195311.1 ABC transporter ATP-binding protein [Ancylobacter crimeensis]